MNRNIVKDNWKKCKDKLNAGWHKLTDHQQYVIADMHVASAGKIKKASPKDECMMKEETLSRREVLRGALAVGCSLLVPALFSAPAHSASTKKASPASVKYQTQPKGEQKCSKCANFIAGSSTCKVVEGKVSPNGWCVMWAKKA